MTFNDAEGIFESVDGKRINFGRTIDWKISPLVDQEERQSYDAVADILLALIWIVLIMSFAMALFKGPLVSTWIFIGYI